MERFLRPIAIPSFAGEDRTSEATGLSQVLRTVVRSPGFQTIAVILASSKGHSPHRRCGSMTPASDGAPINAGAM